MKKIQVRYFAALREAAGVGEEEVTTDSKTLANLYGELSDRHNFGIDPKFVKASRNLKMRSLDEPFVDGDEIVFLPPVAGG